MAVDEQESEVDVLFRKEGGSLTWIANQTRPDIANGIWAWCVSSTPQWDPPEVGL